MAADEARARRITELKENRPDLTWGAIAEAVGVKERSVHHWRQTGGISYDNAKKLATLFPETTLDYIWRGDIASNGTPDMLEALRSSEAQELRKQLDRIEKKLDRLLRQPVRSDRFPPLPEPTPARKKR